MNEDAQKARQNVFQKFCCYGEKLLGKLSGELLGKRKTSQSLSKNI